MEAREIPEVLAEFVNDAVRSTYPPEPRNKALVVVACSHGLPIGKYVTPITSRRNGRPTTPRPGLSQLARGNTSTTLPRRPTVVEWLSYATLRTRRYLQARGMWRTTRQKYGASSKSRVDQPQPNTADPSDATEHLLFHDHRRSSSRLFHP